MQAKNKSTWDVFSCNAASYRAQVIIYYSLLFVSYSYKGHYTFNDWVIILAFMPVLYYLYIVYKKYMFVFIYSNYPLQNDQWTHNVVEQ